MQIKNLFQKDIFRPINGVIKADQLDDLSVWQELDEYVVTKELDQHLRGFFSSYLSSIDSPGDPDVAGQVGVWVSGFFGSGKSHFIKILSYLLNNQPSSSNGTTRQPVEFFEDKIEDPMLLGDIKRAIGTKADVILFNIDSKADSRDRDAILSVFLKVFNEMLGYCGDHPHIADMERYLAKKGKLDQFHLAFQNVSGSSWVDERDAYHFRADQLAEALSQTLGQSRESLSKWLDDPEANFPLTIENFAKWVKEHLESKGSDHRIIFLVDEVGQFIGQDTGLMLSLQTITENLGTVCGGRAWVVVTSQEEIDAVIGEISASAANDFSKIQGRFRTRLSLTSSNTDEVIQARLLSKVDDAKDSLEKVFTEKGDILKHQLSFTSTGMTMKAFRDASDFVANYPFAPYQFQLVQKIFESIRKVGATGLHLSRGERSLLDAFQSAAQQTADEKIGALVPLYQFYPSIESFLDTSVKRTIDQAGDNASLKPFDIDMLRVLFLIRYVDEMTGNVENLVTLSIDQIDADRIAIRKQVEESLERLERETLISRNGDVYFFLTDEERDIGREIKNIRLSSGDEQKLLGELIYDDVLRGNRKHKYPSNNKDFGYTRFCDLHPHGTRTDGDLVVSVITPLIDDPEFFNEAKCINQSTADNGQLLIKLGDDDDLGRELRTYLQTEQYASRKLDGTQPLTTVTIMKERLEDNRQRRGRLISLLEKSVNEAEFYAAGKKLTLKAGSASTAVEEALTYLVTNTYSKLGYLNNLCTDPKAEIQAVLRANNIQQQSLALKESESNPQAVADLRDYIDLATAANRQIVLHELVENRFGRRPYGWPEWEVILLVSRLVVLNEITLSMDGANLPVEKVYDAVITPNRWRKITVLKRRTVDTDALQKARKLGRDVFSTIGPDGEDALCAFLQDKLREWQTNLTGYKTLADTGSYPGGEEITDGLTLIGGLLSEHESFEFIDKFITLKADLLDLSNDVHDLDHFHQSQRPTWDKLRRAHEGFQPNRKVLEKDADANAALKRMEEILKASDPYKLIPEAEKLIKTVDKVNDAAIKERRNHALKQIDARIDGIKKELDAAKAEPNLRNACLYPLQTIRKGIEAETSIAHIHLTQQEATDAHDEAIDRIDAFLREKEGGKKGKAGGKTRRVVKPVELVTKPYLETQEDVDEFLNELRERLEAAIKNSERIQIR